MQTEHAARILGRRSDLHDRDARGVGCEHGGRIGDDLVEFGEDLRLDGLVLDDRLDGQLTVGEVGQLGGVAQPRQRRLALVGGQFALADGPLQRCLDPGLARGGQLVGGFEDHHVGPGFRRYLSDPRTHLPSTDYANALNRIAH